MFEIIFLLEIIIVISTNILWYKIKSILSENGYKVNYWYGHLNDISNFYSLIQKTQDKHKKSTYYKMFWGLLILILIFIILFISGLGT